EQLDHSIRHIESSGLVPPGSERAQAQRMFEVFEADSKAWLTYRPRSYAGPLHVFRALEESTSYSRDAQLGWGRLTTAGLDVRSVPGNHLTMVREPNIRILAAQLTDCLKQPTMLGEE